ncbi:MAG: PA0069 family radical SAM protein [Planctomycetales bacterium]|nr:PA0069 family radical SAM protein [Planctomycetales bacterium]
MSTHVKGRGAQVRPGNRFERVHYQIDLEHFDCVDIEEDGYVERLRAMPTEYYFDETQSIIAENNSPDIPFRYSLNPYRGCVHGCAYCYARPTHEYLGFDAGLDFETKVMVKRDAPRLFRDWLARDAWQPELIAMSGVTDCYQPAERHFRLTRGCLQVASEARQPIGIVTKNALVVRDADILREMASCDTVSVAVSINSLDHELARSLEPRTSTPSARLRAIERLSSAGVATAVVVGPVIPGLNDHEMAAILAAAASAGASSASYILLRLPLAVEPIFVDWLRRVRPSSAEKIIGRIQATRDGNMSCSQFGGRMRGTGPIAEQIANTFQVFAAKYRLDRHWPPLDATQFRPPVDSSGQLRLF